MRTLVPLFFGLALACRAGPAVTVAFTPAVVTGGPVQIRLAAGGRSEGD